MKKQRVVVQLDEGVQKVINEDEEIKALKQFKSIQSTRESKTEIQAFIDKRIAQILNEHK